MSRQCFVCVCHYSWLNILISHLHHSTQLNAAFSVKSVGFSLVHNKTIQYFLPRKRRAPCHYDIVFSAVDEFRNSNWNIYSIRGIKPYFEFYWMPLLAFSKDSPPSHTSGVFFSTVSNDSLAFMVLECYVLCKELLDHSSKLSLWGLKEEVKKKIERCGAIINNHYGNHLKATPKRTVNYHTKCLFFYWFGVVPRAFKSKLSIS